MEGTSEYFAKSMGILGSFQDFLDPNLVIYNL